jgi:hypothetical protein
VTQKYCQFQRFPAIPCLAFSFQPMSVPNKRQQGARFVPIKEEVILLHVVGENRQPCCLAIPNFMVVLRASTIECKKSKNHVSFCTPYNLPV